MACVKVVVEIPPLTSTPTLLKYNPCPNAE
jgi:hypothetical protein